MKLILSMHARDRDCRICGRKRRLAFRNAQPVGIIAKMEEKGPLQLFTFDDDENEPFDEMRDSDVESDEVNFI